MKVSTLKAKIKRIWVEVPGENEGDPAEKVWVDYRPGELTLEVSDELKEAVATGFDTEVAFVMLRRVLVAWDLEMDILDEAGEPTGETRPLTVSDADIKTVPLIFLGQVMQAIEDDSRPNPKRGATLGDGSPQMEPLEASLNGTSSSGQQTGSLVSPGSS